MSYEFFRTQKQFYTYISNMSTDFDFNKSFKYSRHTFVTTDGEVHFFSRLDKELKGLNTLLGKEHFDPAKSRVKGRSGYLIFFKEDDTVEESEVSEVSVETVEDIPTVEDSVAQLISLEAVVEESTVDPDWTWVESLENTKEDKLLLDNYAEEKFNIKLARNMKLSNMIRAFKEGLASA